MKKKNVSTVAELYAAINDPANDGGVTIVLAPGTYTLFDNGQEPRGRLELRRDMSLIGVRGNRSAVVIDAKSLPPSSFTMSFVGAPGQKTGAIRIGRGNHFIAWLTIEGNTSSVAGIATDLTDTGPKDTVIRVEHVVSSGSLRGLDVRNIGTAMAGRAIVAEILHNDFSGKLDQPQQQSQAIRLVNFIGADGGKIHAVMSGNTFHNSPIGCFMGNNRSNSGLVEVRSTNDHFEDNEAGCVIVGANVSTGTTKFATTTFDAHGSDFKDNTQSFPSTSPFPTPRGGIVALGAEILDGATALDNTVQIVLRGCKVRGNQNKDFEAFGARSSGSITGTTNNKVTISFKPASVQVLGTDSQPSQPAGTLPADLNKVTVIPS